MSHEVSTQPAQTPMVQTFMTHRMSDDAIAQLSTGREKEIEILRDALRRSLHAAPGALQHVVIYGPRGFGKSFMARLAQIEARSLDGAAIPFVLLPEEQHNLTRNPHALLDYIAHRLADLRTGQDQSWQGAMFQWPDPDEQARKWNTAVKHLNEEIERSLPGGQGLAVVAIENFDFLLSTVFKDSAAEQRLRKWLDRPNNRLMLIATAAGTVDMDYDRPLFQAFQSLRLAPWSPENCLAYFERRRAAEGRPRLDAQSRPKARAVADFIGGNPRLAQLLAGVLDTHDAMSVANIMDALADKLADYYRRRIDDLPGLSQGLLDALIRGGEPASQTELAARVGAGSQAAIARTMQELLRADVIRGTPSLDSRETLYRVTDRVLVHFYRVRQGQQQAVRTQLAAILDFLQAYYSRDEQRQEAVRALRQGRPAEARVFADLARDDHLGFNSYQSEFIWRWERAMAVASESAPWTSLELRDELDTRAEYVNATAQQWHPSSAAGRAARVMVEAQSLERLDLQDEAEQVLSNALQDRTDINAQALLLHERAAIRAESQDKRELADGDNEALALLNPDGMSDLMKILVLKRQSQIAFRGGRYDESAQKAHEAAALAQRSNDWREQAESLGHAAVSLSILDQHDEALASALAAHALEKQCGDGDEVYSWALFALEAAAHVSSLAAVLAYIDLLRADAASPYAQRRIFPCWYINDWLVAAIRAAAWDAVDSVLAEPTLFFADELWISGHGIGATVASVALQEGRAEGFNAMRKLLPRLRHLTAHARTQDAKVEKIVATIIADFAEACRNPALLRDVAGLLTPELAANAPDQAALLRTLAEFDESKTPDAWLTRADPDLVIWLRSVRNLSALGVNEKVIQTGARKRKTR